MKKKMFVHKTVHNDDIILVILKRIINMYIKLINKVFNA